MRGTFHPRPELIQNASASSVLYLCLGLELMEWVLNGSKSEQCVELFNSHITAKDQPPIFSHHI